MKSIGKCRVCGSVGETRQFDFYAFGSEGVEMCMACQISTSNFIKAMAEASNRAKATMAKVLKYAEVRTN